MYPQKQASLQVQEESNAVILSQNIVFDYDIQYVAELSTTNLKRDSIYFCEHTRAYVYLNQKNQINSGLIPDDIDIKNHQKFHKHLLSIIGTEIRLSIHGSINNSSFFASINREDNQTFVSSSLQTPSSRIGVNFLLKKDERQTVVGLKVSHHTVSKNTFFHIDFTRKNSLAL